MKYQKLFLLPLLVLPQILWAEPEDGKSSDMTKGHIKPDKAPYTYSPILPEFWTQVEKILQSKDHKKLIVIGEKQLNAYGEATPEGQEAKLAQAIGFYNENLIYASFHFFLNIARSQAGSEVGNHAIFYLAEIAKNHAYDKNALYTFIDNQDLDNLPRELQDFFSYFKSIVLLKDRHTQWAKKHLLKIQEGSHWDLQRQYMSALALVANKKTDLAFEKLTQLSTLDDLHPHLKSKVYLQLARFNFEKGEFKTSLVFYEGIGDLGVREKGRLLLEKAWTLFYLKEYSKALGALHALRAPFFRSSVTPEAYILQMLIFRDLCYYDAIRNLGNEFRSRFLDAFKLIHKRWDLAKSPVLFGMAVMNLEVQITANLIAKMREELEEFKKNSWSKYTFYKPLLRAYRHKDKELQLTVDRQLEGRLRSAALEMLKSANEVQFLEFKSALDATKTNGESAMSKFKHEEITHYRFDKIYWPVNQEVWFEELKSYTVNVTSRCHLESDKKQINLEEQFR